MSVTEIKPARSRPLRLREIDYPTGDGKPMAETVPHREAMAYAIDAAQIALEHIPDRWISGNDFVYYKQGDPKKRVSPDCYVVLDVPRHLRLAYKVWEENGRTPNLVIEFTSKGTAMEDRKRKFDLYQNVLKVNEYILFDPLDQYLRPRLQGFCLVNGVYVPIVPDGKGRLLSVETGILMFAEGQLLRFVHPLTGEVILTRQEAEAKRLAEAKRAEEETKKAQEEAKRAEEEMAKRQAAEAEIARLKAELEALRKGNG